MKSLNENKLNKLLDYIKKYQVENGKSPSYRTIMKAMSFNNLATVYRYVNKLYSLGLIKKDDFGGIAISMNLNIGRTIVAPLVGIVNCGNPTEAIENIEANFALPVSIFGTGEIKILHANGESMIGAGIFDKDFLVIKKDCFINDGDIVVARIGNEATTKRLFRRNGKIVLHPENPNFQDIIVNETEVEIEGKVVSAIHKF